MLPLEVLQKAQSQMLNYEGSGMSVMEMSHRSKAYDEIITTTQARLRRILNIPDNYKVLFMQGGGTMQFSMVPLNLLQKGKADYILTGYFAEKAYKEACKFGDIKVAASSKEQDFTFIPKQEDLNLDPEADYVYYVQTTRFMVQNGNMCLKQMVYQSLRICQVTSLANQLMFQNLESSLRALRKTWAVQD